MRMLFVVVAAVAAGLPAVGSASGSAVRVEVARLTGAAEVPKGSPVGSGRAVIRLNTKTGRACWTLTVTGIGKPLSAHVHKGRPGKAGPVVIPLGARFAAKGCVTAPRKSIAAVATNPNAYYVNVHTRKYLNGAIRGQLHASA